MMQDQQQLKVAEISNYVMEGSVAVSAASPLLPLPPIPARHRRPKVREVSSRFMSPVVSNIHSRPRQPEVDSLGATDDNIPIESLRFLSRLSVRCFVVARE